MILVVSGGIGAGESTFCDLLIKHNFQKESLSNILRELVKKEGKEIVRKNLRAKADSLRLKYGKAALAIMAWEKIKNLKGNWVIESFMAKEETDFFREKGAKVIGVVAPDRLRYERVLKRQGRDTFSSFEEFLKIDLKKRDIGIDSIIEDADFIIVNDGSLEELNEMVTLFVESIFSSHEKN